MRVLLVVTDAPTGGNSSSNASFTAAALRRPLQVAGAQTNETGAAAPRKLTQAPRSP